LSNQKTLHSIKRPNISTEKLKMVAERAKRKRKGFEQREIA
jgi:hypothetical protein